MKTQRLCGRITALQIVEHIPGREFRINPRQVLKHVSNFDRDDSMGLRQVKQRLRDKLKSAS